MENTQNTPAVTNTNIIDQNTTKKTVLTFDEIAFHGYIVGNHAVMYVGNCGDNGFHKYTTHNPVIKIFNGGCRNMYVETDTEIIRTRTVDYNHTLDAYKLKISEVVPPNFSDCFRDFGSFDGLLRTYSIEYKNESCMCKNPGETEWSSRKFCSGEPEDENRSWSINSIPEIEYRARNGEIPTGRIRFCGYAKQIDTFDGDWEWESINIFETKNHKVLGTFEQVKTYITVQLEGDDNNCQLADCYWKSYEPVHKGDKVLVKTDTGAIHGTVKHVYGVPAYNIEQISQPWMAQPAA